ncbi:MAG: hypothetical protein MJE68_09150 [Proteobacteria bacterium]|nr:hypothetical protein [Pseudomonadota bacterium]
MIDWTIRFCRRVFQPFKFYCESMTFYACTCGACHEINGPIPPDRPFPLKLVPVFTDGPPCIRIGSNTHTKTAQKVSVMKGNIINKCAPNLFHGPLDSSRGHQRIIRAWFDTKWA